MAPLPTPFCSADMLPLDPLIYRRSLQPQHLFKGVRAEDLLVDAVVGIALFKAGGPAQP